MNLQSTFQPVFDAIPDTLPSNLTFMEIAGYPHYENVCSNILKFYLNPKTKLHGLDDLLFKSLLQSSNKLNAPFTDFDNVTVKREVVTDKGRIDLVLFTNRWVIGIENKIRHTLQNDLDEYSTFLRKQFNGRECLKIVLSLKKEGNLIGEFINVTYKDLIRNIEANLKSFNGDVNNKYYIFFIQFIETIKNMFMSTEMDRDQIEFLVNNQDKISQLIALDNKLNNYISFRAYKIRDAINVGENYKKWVYDNYDVGFNYTHGEVSYKLECPINRDEIRIKLCVESNKIDYELLKKLDFFKNRNIEDFRSNEENSKLILEENIDFFITDDLLIEKLKGYLNELKIS